MGLVVDRSGSWWRRPLLDPSSRDDTRIRAPPHHPPAGGPVYRSTSRGGPCNGNNVASSNRCLYLYSLLIADYAALQAEETATAENNRQHKRDQQPYLILKSLLLTGKLTVKERPCLDVSMVGIRQWRVCWCVIVCDVISNTCVSTIGHTY